MKIVRKLSVAGATREQLQKLETEVGATLPKDYEQFLSEDNGGRPEPASFAFHSQQGPNEDIVAWFLTLNPDESFHSTWDFIDIYNNRIPEGVLPIGCDPFGNLLLLGLEGESRGRVFFWNHEHESEDEPTWDNVSLVAESFRAFIAGLY